MKWRENNASKSSSSNSSVINRVLPTWLKKLKLKSEFAEPKNSRGGGNSNCYDSDDEIEVPMLSCSSWRSRSRSEEKQRLNAMVSEIRKMSEMQYKERFPQENDVLKGTKARESKGVAARDQESRTLNGNVWKEKRAGKMRGSRKAGRGTSQSAEKDVIEVESGRKIRMNDDFLKSRASNSRKQRSLSCPSYGLQTIKEDRAFESLELEEATAISEEEYISEWQKLKDSKIKEIMSKTEHQRESVYINRGNQKKGGKQNRRIKAFSPRTAGTNECKIKALEGMKRAKKITRKKRKEEKGIESRTAFHSYAVVKTSFDPQQDFRDSMLEMMIEKGIKRAEELEELLVCYLSLNRDDYHDLIIKVFRQVWFELN